MDAYHEIDIGNVLETFGKSRLDVSRRKASKCHYG
jgi:hypothetical protein